MDPRATTVIELMTRFALRTGVGSDRAAHRYLWTDAFAVCNLLGLAETTGDRRHEDLAVRLVDQVHHALGRHRADDSRSGFISGLSDAEGAAHPTIGGLRIGKPLPERTPEEPPDPDLEWERDGQYFHYLTKWMHALDQTARRTRRATFDVWARELAGTAHRAFAYGPPGRRRMVWKASIDLSRPLVSSMGQHDPLDGFVTYTQLASSTKLRAAIADFDAMIDRDSLATADPLGLGGLLFDACRLAQIGDDRERIAALLAATARGLRAWLVGPDLRSPARRRLAFRELGLAIGLAGLPILRASSALDASARASLAELEARAPIRDEIEAFWLHPDHRRTAEWTAHADINEVMLATSLLPSGFLVLGRRATPS